MISILPSEEQLLLREAARSFLAERYPITWVRKWTEAEEEERRELHRRLWADLAEMGWLGLLWPEEVGGSAQTFVEQAIVLEELGRALIPSPYLGTLLAAAVVDRVAESRTRQSILSDVCAGRLSMALAVFEDASEDLSFFATRARSVEGRAVLSGRKAFVADAILADALLVAADDAEQGRAWFLVDAAAEGVRRTAPATMDVTRPVCEIELHEAEGQRIGAFEESWEAVQSMHWAALAAEAVGGCEQVLAASVAYAGERVQFGTPIGANQAIAHKCSDMLVRTEAARAIAYHAAREIASAENTAPFSASMAKACATEAYREVASEGIQIHGGVGFTWEFDCHFFYKRARASEITAGHPDAHRERIAAWSGL